MSDRQIIGRIVVLTGHGKGKSSSAFGMALRAAGWDKRVCVIQFIKKASRKTGEIQAAQRLGIEWHTLGDGFTWDSPDLERDKATSRRIWQFCQEKILSAAYDMIILDEINAVLSWGWLDLPAVLHCLQVEKPAPLHLILTGRDAPAELMAAADTVTEMVEVKHAFQQGVRACKGIEF
ncbi:cob(I)yrinic acid a,c-diamide adenosyltransferase [Candidatus Magnetaquicoccus inordinatus]|uniref:cob(I)yrinic acid a,c-diamide adenosyltransferase n=1 Tax=Candidatus Magnetaquicoccus inordinatus TaxID=2496818 RepID=UPI00102B9DFA|nr:cob(I)yrinic acid a,c-diamide adenosyltransferase [Candidatus Magnetaquicoccus inordinatus]